MPLISTSVKRSLLFCTLLIWACRKEMPSTPPSLSQQAETVVVEWDAGWFFTYATPEGRFETAYEAEKVPEVSRGVARAQNPDNKAASEAPRKNGAASTMDDIGRLAPRAIATEIVPGPVVKGIVRGKNATAEAPSAPSACRCFMASMRSGSERRFQARVATNKPPAMRSAAKLTPKNPRM